jgi:P pilus assembly chaperone PapD
VSRGTAAVSALALVVTAAAVVTAGRVGGPLPSSGRHAQTVAVSTAVRTCPGAGLDPRSDTSVFATTVGARAQRGGGALTVGPVTAAASGPRLRLTDRQRATVVPWRPALGATVLRGVGSLAPGAVGAQWSLPRRGAASAGTAVAECLPPAADWWFAGAATSVGSTSTLVLSNPSSSVAVVDLTFFGPAGEVATPGSRGLAVAPRSSRSIGLSSFAPAVSALTVDVHAAQGLVGAAVHVSRSDGSHRGGSEWLPAGEPPSTDVLVEPAAAAADRRVVVTNPTSREALVQAQVIDSGGEFTPVGFTDLRLPPGSVKQLRLGRAAAGPGAAVHLTSTTPVVAATVATRSGRAADFAVTASGPQLQRAGVVPVVPETSVTVGLVSTSRSATAVTVEAFSTRGRSLGRQRVAVPGRTVTDWTLRRSKGRAAYVVLLADGSTAGLYAVANYTGPAGISALAVRPGTYTVVRPAVTASVTTP